MACKCRFQTFKKRRSIYKPSEILVEDFSEQCSVIRGLLHGLRDAMLKQVKFSLFMELISFHAKKGVVPPGLRIGIKPTGFEEGDNSQIWTDWNNHIYKCSWEFVNILKYYYEEEIYANQWLKNSLKRQCIDAIALHNQCDRQTAIAYVENWIGKSATSSVNTFAEMFHKENYGSIETTCCRLIFFFLCDVLVAFKLILRALIYVQYFD